MAWTDIFTGTDVSNFLTNAENNPRYQQAMTQLRNQQPINEAAWNAYRQYLGNVPEQQVAGMDPMRAAGIQNQVNAALGQGAGLAGQGVGTLGTIQSGAGASQQALQNLAMGGGVPQFGSQAASDYQSFMNPSLLGAQQALANQANLGWNKSVGNIGGVGGGFLSSGRENALAQAAENAATQLGASQQQLAYNAAQQAAQAGQRAGELGYQGQLGAAQALGSQALQGAQLTNQLQQALIQPGSIQEAGGAAMQQQRQNELNAQYQNELLRQQNAFKALQYLQQGLGTLGSTTQAADINTPNNTIALLNALGGPGYAQQVLGGLVGAGADWAGDLIGQGIDTVGGWLGDVGSSILDWWD